MFLTEHSGFFKNNMPPKTIPFNQTPKTIPFSGSNSSVADIVAQHQATSSYNTAMGIGDTSPSILSEAGDQIVKGGKQIFSGADVNKPISEQFGDMGAGALNVAGGAIRALFSPVEAGTKIGSQLPVIKQVVDAVKTSITDPTSDWISNSPKLQEFMTKYPHADEVVGNLISVLSSIAGGEKAPEIKGIVNDTANTLAEAPGQIKQLATDTKQGLQNTDKINAKNTENGIRIVAPDLTPGEMADALASGKVMNKPLSSKIGNGKMAPDFSGDSHIQDLYNSTKHVINPDATTYSENLGNVRKGIINTSENVVKPLLEKNPTPFNFGDLRSALDNVQPTSAIKNDPSAFSNYNRIKEELLGVAEKSLRETQTAGGKSVSGITDLNDLWTPGKAIDTYIQKQLGDTTLGSPAYTGVKAAAQDLRNGFRQFMSDSMRYPGQMESLNRMTQFIREMPDNLRQTLNPENLQALREQFGVKATATSESLANILDQKMQKLHDMFEVRDSLASKARKEQGTTPFSRYMANHPLTKSVTNAVTGALKVGSGVDAISHL